MNQIVPAPATARQLLLSFTLYDAANGLASLTDRMDFAGVTRRQVLAAASGRLPPARDAADGEAFNPEATLAQALEGDDFQARLREIVLAAFPDKRRLVFIHVPKCAGTDLQVTLERQYPSLNQHLCLTQTTPKAALFEHLAEFARGVHLAGAIAVSGHQPLRWYLDRGLLRFEDDVFTSMRHPRDILYSYVSFILTRCLEASGKPRGDVAHWLGEIGLKQLEPNPSPAYLADIGSQWLRVRKPNIICNYLGTGTAASSFQAMVQSDIEVTDVSRYSAWRRQKFGYEPAHRLNPSKPLFTPATASAADRSLVEEMIGEDMLVYEAVQAKLAASGELSMRGRSLG